MRLLGGPVAIIPLEHRAVSPTVQRFVERIRTFAALLPRCAGVRSRGKRGRMTDRLRPQVRIATSSPAAGIRGLLMDQRDARRNRETGRRDQAVDRAAEEASLTSTRRARGLPS